MVLWVQSQRDEKNLISEYGRLHDFKNYIVDRLKSDKKSCKYFYKLYLKNIKESPLRWGNKWPQELRIQIYDWGYIYSSPIRATRNIKLQNIQFKLSHRLTATNYFLFKCGLKETEPCTFCTETKESLLHLFLEMHLHKTSLAFISKYFRKLWS